MNSGRTQKENQVPTEFSERALVNQRKNTGKMLSRRAQTQT